MAKICFFALIQIALIFSLPRHKSSALDVGWACAAQERKFPSTFVKQMSAETILSRKNFSSKLRHKPQHYVFIPLL